MPAAAVCDGLSMSTVVRGRGLLAAAAGASGTPTISAPAAAAGSLGPLLLGARVSSSVLACPDGPESPKSELRPPDSSAGEITTSSGATAADATATAAAAMAITGAGAAASTAGSGSAAGTGGGAGAGG